MTTLRLVPEDPSPEEEMIVRRLLANYRCRLTSRGLNGQLVDQLVAAATDFVDFVEEYLDVHPAQALAPATPA